jgi:hypothetical protein
MRGSRATINTDSSVGNRKSFQYGSGSDTRNAIVYNDILAVDNHIACSTLPKNYNGFPGDYQIPISFAGIGIG